MKTRLLLSIICLTFSILANAQVAIGQRDSSGKKNGKWPVYWDKNWNEVKDSSRAIYVRYTYYDHGTDIYPMGPRGKDWKLSSLDSVHYIGRLIILNGEYKWYDEKGVMRSDETFRNGEYVLYKWYYSTGELNQIFDYTDHWNSQAYSWHVIEYDKKGKVTRDTFINAVGYNR